MLIRFFSFGLLNILIISSATICAQDFNKDYQIAVNQFVGLDDFKLALTINTESDSQSLNDFAMARNYMLYKANDVYYYDMEEIEMIIEPDAQITIDHEAEMILLKFGDFQSVFDHFNELKIPENLIEQNHTGKFLGESDDGIKTYEFLIDDDQIKKVSISFDREDLFIHEINYEYAENLIWDTDHVSVRYDLQRDFDNELIPSISSFIELGKVGWKTTSQYAEYSLKLLDN